MTGIGKQFILSAALLLLALLSVACHRSSPLKRLGAIDSLVNARPDSALTLLNTLLPDTNQMSKRTLMRFHLLRINAENKCDTVFPARHAALMRRVCDYYDHRSSKRFANDRMLAHYLLGRCYDDMGEAPAALQEYHNAADTTKADRNFLILSRVHGQIADLLLRMQLLQNNMDELVSASRYALLAGDTLSSIIYQGMKSHVYLQQKDTVAFLANMEEEAHSYEKIGEEAFSAMSKGGMAYILIEQGNLGKAREYMQLFEEKSGLFNERGDILRGHENYYNTKGLYYLSCGDTDSALLFYRKAYRHGDHNCRILAAQGLSRLFSSQHRYDSANWYSQESYLLNDSAYSYNTARSLQQMRSIFNYHRHERAAAIRLQQLNIRTSQLEMALLALVVFVLVGYLVTLRHRKRQRMRSLEQAEAYEVYRSERERLESEKTILSDLLNKEQQLKKENMLRIQAEKDLLQEQQSKLIAEINHKNQLVERLQQDISGLEASNKYVQRNYTLDAKMASTRIFRRFNGYAENRRTKPSEEDWEKLISMVEGTLPSFKPVVRGKSCVEGDDYRVCVLVRLGFSPTKVCSVTEKNYDYVTKVRKRLLKKIFHIDGHAKDFDNMIMNIV